MFGRRRFDVSRLTTEYLARHVDSRMVDVIREHLAGCGSVVDVACGSGLYGPHLAQVVPSVHGIDHDPALCETARGTGAYDGVVCDRVERVGDHFGAVDAVFCSEFLEHVENEHLREVVDAIEAVATRRMVITVPNPLSPHFKHDPTHVGRYTVVSMLRTLDRSSRFSYRLLPLGFADDWRARWWARALQPVAARVAVLSPTVLYLGTRR